MAASGTYGFATEFYKTCPIKHTGSPRPRSGAEGSQGFLDLIAAEDHGQGLSFFEVGVPGSWDAEGVGQQHVGQQHVGQSWAGR